VDSGNSTKKSKALWDAYIIAAENHDLDWFKEMLSSHEQAVHDEDQAAKEKKAAKRKSTAAEESEDVEMNDAAEDGAASTKKAKASKKRKAESEVEQEKVCFYFLKNIYFWFIKDRNSLRRLPRLN